MWVIYDPLQFSVTTHFNPRINGAGRLVNLVFIISQADVDEPEGCSVPHNDQVAAHYPAYYAARF